MSDPQKQGLMLTILVSDAVLLVVAVCAAVLLVLL
jgi:hypothetical protein